MTEQSNQRAHSDVAVRFKVREVEQADLPAVYSLYRSIEPDHNISFEAYSAWWRWLFLESPAGQGFALGGFSDEGVCFGHVGMVPFAYFVDGHSVVAGFPCKLMVAQTHRKSLLYPTLVQRLLRTYTKHGMSLTLAPITRARVLEANLALGFKRGPRFAVLARPIAAEKLAREILPGFLKPFAPLASVANPLLRPAWRLGKSREFVVDVLNDWQGAASFLEISRAWARCIQPQRTMAMMKWRFRAELGRGYVSFGVKRRDELVGYAVVRPMPMLSFRALGIVDINWNPDVIGAGSALLRRIHQEAVAQGVDLVAALVDPGGELAGELRKIGYMPTPAAFTWVSHQPAGAAVAIHARPAVDWAEGWLAHDYV
ncbi:MAG: GNAT family N-acetyltransferase [Verrucomicrobiaceae bacterium]|nr:MAG: GNAT family N-acetyltransferase [Verrucomicrobiaceae bacterium]